jgi:hypothetical protein
VDPRRIVRRSTPRWRRTQYLTSLLGAVALLAAVGTGSAFAADPLPPDDDQTLDPQERPIGRALPIFVIDHTGDPIVIKPAIPKTLAVERPGQDPDVDADPDAATSQRGSSKAGWLASADLASADLVSIDAQPTLPATDTAPAPSQDPMDPRTATLLALVIGAIGWGAAWRPGGSSNR